MAHRHDVYKYGRFIEHEFKFVGKFGAKGEQRAEKKKTTPEQVDKQNQYNREKKVLRKMRYNFEPGDLWITLKLQKGERLPADEILKIRDKFFRNLNSCTGQQIKRNTGSSGSYLTDMGTADRWPCKLHSGI